MGLSSLKNQNSMVSVGTNVKENYPVYMYTNIVEDLGKYLFNHLWK